MPPGPAIRQIRRRHARRRTDTSAETALLRTTTFTIACTWPFWQFEAISRCFPGSTFTSHWYPLTTSALFTLANLAMIVACILGRRRLLVLTLRATALTVPVALLLLTLRPYEGNPATGPGIWFTGFSGLPAVAAALTVPMRAGVPLAVAVIGGTSVLNAVLEDRTDLPGLVGEVGFSLVYTLPLVVVACATMHLARIIDTTDAEARAESVAAARLRARAAETTRFTALVHDHVLSALAGVAKGVRPAGPAGMRLTAAFTDTGTVSTDDLADALTTTVHRHSPDCTVTVRGLSTAETTDVPGAVAANMVLALAEAAKNSTTHAGAAATRTCRITVGAVGNGDVRVRYTDDGAGFRTDDIRPTAAGIRISVLGRMDATEGCSARVTSAPGDGTTVELHWRAGAASSPELSPVHAGRRPSTPGHSGAGRPVFDLLQMNHIFSWQYGVSVLVVFALMVLANERPTDPASLTALALLTVATVILVSGRSYPLPAVRTTVTVALLVTVTELGRWQDLSDAAVWSHAWHIMACSLLAALLALRGRPLSAILSILGGAVAVEVTGAVTDAPEAGFSGVQVVLSSILVGAAALLTVAVRYSVSRLPAARSSLRDAEDRAAAATEIADYRRDNLARLRTEVQPVLDAAATVDGEPDAGIPDDIREQARLTELRLRDTVRSPLLDLSDIHRAAWDARARGVTVQLLDDRTHQRADGEPSEPEPLSDGLTARILAALRGAEGGTEGGPEGGTVTVRLLPEGRRTFATVSDADGVTRYDRDGRPQRR